MNTFENLPNPLNVDKKDILDILLREEYGYLPSRPFEVTATLEKRDKKFCAGKAELLTLQLKCKAEWGEFTFPVYYAYHKEKQNVPCFIHVNFTNLIPDKYQPTEEIVDNGFATLTFCYKDVSSDDGDFTNGLAGIIYPDSKRKPDSCGKIGLWAWAAMAVMDYAQTLPELDKSRISVIGHSRLGKTALLAGALDERFYCAFSNDSGCSGAALSREKTGETIADIVRQFPFWFCENYYKYADNENSLPFDQHWLIAANIPHKVYVASADGDPWAHPQNEYLGCVFADEYYKSKGLTGFISPDGIPNSGEYFHDGDIAYHIRAGAHYLSREDWLYYIGFLKRQSN